MSHEHGLERTGAARPAPTERDHDVPGRYNASHALSRPVYPVASGILMRKAARDGNGVAADADAAVAAAVSSAGSPLPAALQRKFESSLGTDLSGVRIHTGGLSATANQAVGAKAYTVGQDIHFGAGEYDPASPAGEHLLAHEVAHTVQQRGGAPARQNKLAVSSPHDHAEHEADRAADAMVAGAPVDFLGGGSGMQRKAKGEATVEGVTADTDGNVKLKKTFLGKDYEVATDSEGVEVSVSVPQRTFEPKPLVIPGPKWVLAPGLMVSVQLSGTASGSATLEGKAKITPDGVQLTSAKYEIKGSLGVALSVIGTAGVPGVSALNGEARAGLKAELVGSGTVAGSDAGLTADLSAKASIVAGLSLHVSYEAFWLEKKTEFAKYVLGEWTIAEASAGIDGGWNPQTGEFSGNVRDPQFQWNVPSDIQVQEGMSVEEYQQRSREFREAVEKGDLMKMKELSDKFKDDEAKGGPRPIALPSMQGPEPGGGMSTGEDGGMCSDESSGAGGGTSGEQTSSEPTFDDLCEDDNPSVMCD